MKTVAQVVDQLKSRVCPIFRRAGPREGRETPPQLGTGILYGFGQCSLIITAGHVVESVGNGLVLRGPGPKETVAAFHHLHPTHPIWNVRGPYEAADVACIPLGLELAQEISQLSEFTDPVEIGDVDDIAPDCDALYVLIGFPHSKNKSAVTDPKTGLARKPWGNTVFSAQFNTRLPSEFLNGLSDSTHFVLQAAREYIESQTGEKRKAPEMAGMSGGGIWKLDVIKGTEFVKRCRLVGTFIEREAQGGVIVIRAVKLTWATDLKMWHPDFF